MIVETEYFREKAVEYAKRWALDRNPLFANYEGIGGDCTNFASQAVYAGSCKMNFTPTFGWYYITDAQRSASWTGVEFFYNFITQNEGVGPFGETVEADLAEIGDIIQLANAEGDFYHTLVITEIRDGDIYISAHSEDSFMRPLSSYNYASLRYIHIKGVRYDVVMPYACYDDLLSGAKLNIQ